MPFINTVTTKRITENERELIKKELGKLIEIFPGKSEQWLMLAFSENTPMYFRGDSSGDCAYVEVCIFGSAKDESYDLFTEKICELYEKELNISSDRIYVRYEESEHWGWNGSNF